MNKNPECSACVGTTPINTIRKLKKKTKKAICFIEIFFSKAVQNNKYQNVTLGTGRHIHAKKNICVCGSVRTRVIVSFIVNYR